MADNDQVHVALAFCDPKGTYCRHAAVTAASIFANTGGRVCVHIVHDDTLTAVNREKLLALAEKYGQEIDFINIESVFDEERIDVSRLTIDGARGTLFRLLLPDVSGEEKMNLWFAGFCPAGDPQYTVVVLQDGQTQPAHSSAAVFAQVCEALWLLEQ